MFSAARFHPRHRRLGGADFLRHLRLGEALIRTGFQEFIQERDSSLSFWYSALTSALPSALARNCLCVSIFPLLHVLARESQFLRRRLIRSVQ